MKRLLKTFLAITLMINIISLTVLASSSEYEFDDYGIKKEVKLETNIKKIEDSKGDWTEFNEKTDVLLSKEWTITFSGKLTEKKIDGMVIEKDDKSIPVKIKLTEENKATVAPVEYYEPNSNYTLKILLNNGKKYKMYFTTIKDNSDNVEYTDEKYFEFDKEKGEIIAYKDDAPKDVAIPKTISGVTVKSIGDNAFREKDLTSIIIPESVISIGEFGLLGNELTSVVIPPNIKSIELYAFACNKLSSVIIPSGVTSIGDAAFLQNRLTSIIIPVGVKHIGVQSFFDNFITSVRIPTGVTSIENSVFDSNPITSVTISAGVTGIDEYAFYDYVEIIRE